MIIKSPHPAPSLNSADPHPTSSPIDAGQKPSVISIEDAGILLGYKRAHAYQLFTTGKVPGLVHVGKNKRVSVEALTAWLTGEHAEHPITFGESRRLKKRLKKACCNIKAGV